MLFVTYGRKGKEFSFYKEVRTFKGKNNICQPFISCSSFSHLFCLLIIPPHFIGIKIDALQCKNDIGAQVEAARRLTTCSRPRAKEGIKVGTFGLFHGCQLPLVGEYICLKLNECFWKESRWRAILLCTFLNQIVNHNVMLVDDMCVLSPPSSSSGRETFIPFVNG